MIIGFAISKADGTGFVTALLPEAGAYCSSTVRKGRRKKMTPPVGSPRRQEVRREMEGPQARVHSSASNDPDFSATTDLHSIVSNAYTMRLTLFDYQEAIAAIVAALLPFIPVWLSVIPQKTLSKGLIRFIPITWASHKALWRSHASLAGY
jgi:hypothetical protein